MRRILGTTRDDESFYQMWNLAEYRSTLRRRNDILLMEWDRRRVLEDRFPQKRFTDSDAQAPSEESQAEAVHKCPNCDYASTNSGAFARHVKAHKITGELDNACGRSIRNWINGPFYNDPPGMTSGHPCTNYSRAGVGRQRPEPMPKGASTKKRSIEVALEASEGEEHSQIAIMQDIKRRLRIAKTMTESSQRLALALQREENMKAGESTLMEQSQRDSRQSMDLLSHRVAIASTRTTENEDQEYVLKTIMEQERVEAEQLRQSEAFAKQLDKDIKVLG